MELINKSKFLEEMQRTYDKMRLDMSGKYLESTIIFTKCFIDIIADFPTVNNDLIKASKEIMSRLGDTEYERGMRDGIVTVINPICDADFLFSSERGWRHVKILY